jgi:hypothetical protein
MKIAIALLCAVSILAASSKANAESIFVGKVPTVQTWPNGASFLEFQLDPDLGRAWVSADFCERYFPADWAASDCRPYNRYKFRVRGLTYDGSLGVIRFGRHVCALVENGLMRPIVRQTGRCNLTTATIRQDYGFERNWRSMDVITLQVR